MSQTGNSTYTQSMNGLIVFDDGAGTVIEDGVVHSDTFSTLNFTSENIDTDTLTATSIDSDTISATSLTTNAIQATTAIADANLYTTTSGDVKIGSTNMVSVGNSIQFTNKTVTSALNNDTINFFNNIVTGTLNILTGVRTAGALNICSNLGTTNIAPVNIGGTNTSATSGSLSRINLNLNGANLWSNTNSSTSFRSNGTISMATTNSGNINIGQEAGTFSDIFIGRSANSKTTTVSGSNVTLSPSLTTSITGTTCAISSTTCNLSSPTCNVTGTTLNITSTGNVSISPSGSTTISSPTCNLNSASVVLGQFSGGTCTLNNTTNTVQGTNCNLNSTNTNVTGGLYLKANTDLSLSASSNIVAANSSGTYNLLYNLASTGSMLLGGNGQINLGLHTKIGPSQSFINYNLSGGGSSVVITLPSAGIFEYVFGANYEDQNITAYTMVSSGPSSGGTLRLFNQYLPSGFALRTTVINGNSFSIDAGYPAVYNSFRVTYIKVG